MDVFDTILNLCIIILLPQRAERKKNKSYTRKLWSMETELQMGVYCRPHLLSIHLDKGQGILSACSMLKPIMMAGTVNKDLMNG